jgi:hypothetical protein
MGRNADLEAADAARRRLGGTLGVLLPDAAIAAHLASGELLVAVRRGALLDRRATGVGTVGRGRSDAVAGDLYLTTSRLIHLGPDVTVIPLATIHEAIATTGSLLLVLDRGTGVALSVADPMVLRVELAATRRAAVVPIVAATGTPGR